MTELMIEAFIASDSLVECQEVSLRSDDKL